MINIKDLVKSIVGDLPIPFIPGIYDDWLLHYKEEMEIKLLSLIEWMITTYLSTGEKSEAIKFSKVLMTKFRDDQYLFEHINSFSIS